MPKGISDLDRSKISKNRIDFQKELRIIADAVDQDALAVVKTTTSFLIKTLVLNTPVKSGRARGGWRLGVGEDAAGETGRLDPSGTSGPSQELAKLNTMTKVGIVYLTNDVPYIVELDQGKSPQQQVGIVDFSIALLGLTAVTTKQG